MNIGRDQEVSKGALKLLTFMMFLIFAMTTDAVGVIIPEVIRDYGLSLTQAATFHYGTMIAIAISGVGLGFLADRFGRKRTILLGLGLFALVCFLFPLGNNFTVFLVLLMVSGLAIGIFKTAALALIGDISNSGQEHTKTMNLAEGFFGVGAIIGPAIVTYFLSEGVSWVYLYAVAGACAVVLILVASFTRYPSLPKANTEQVNWRSSLRLMKDSHALLFSLAIALYVVVEAGVYVWMPTLLLDYQGSSTWIAAYALSLFFIFRAAGRFLAAWILNFVAWQAALLFFSACIFMCFLLSVMLGIEAAVWLLPASGLFMSLIYPTLNSKGISCFPQQEHGAIAGVILFFTALAAALGPLVMGLVGDLFGHVIFGFYFATFSAGGLLLLSLWNYLRDPSRLRLAAC